MGVHQRTEWVELEDAGDREYGLASLLGNAKEVLGAVIYRRTGIGWLLEVLDDEFDPHDLQALEAIDCLKLEFVTKRELMKEDLGMLKAAGFKTAGRGSGWPRFRSTTPGWHPWHIDQAEAAPLLLEPPTHRVRTPAGDPALQGGPWRSASAYAQTRGIP